jgi:hypothetical protein
MGSEGQVKSFGRELELLVACEQLAIEKVFRLISGSRGSPPLSWDRFYQLASVHGLQSQAFHSLLLARGGGAPDALIAALRQDHRDSVARDLFLTAETLRLVSELAGRGIKSLVLKGCAISNFLYQPNTELRHFTDIDLLVTPGDFLDAEFYLKRNGYVRTNPTFEPSHSARDMVNYLLHAHTFVRKDTNVIVDLHQRLTSNPYWMNVDPEEIFESTVTIRLSAGEIRSLGPRVLTPYLCCHAFGHGFMRLRWLGDVARAFAQVSADQAEAIAAQAQGYGAYRHLILASRLVSRLFGCETPFGRFAYSKSQLARQEEAILRMIIHAKMPSYQRTISSLSEELSSFVLNSTLGSHQAKLHSLANLLCDPRDTLFLGAGRKWLLLYLIAGPFLSLLRFILREAPAFGAALRSVVRECKRLSAPEA